MSDLKVPEHPPKLAIVDSETITPEVVDEFDQPLFAEELDRCGKRTATGGECKLPVAVAGATVCRLHGGSAPQVQEAAVERLRVTRDDALERLTQQLKERGERLDPRVLLDIVTRLTSQVELLEGRATARTESSELKIEEVRQVFNARLDVLASSYERAPRVLDMVDKMMGEGEYAEEAADG